MRLTKKDIESLKFCLDTGDPFKDFDLDEDMLANAVLDLLAEVERLKAKNKKLKEKLDAPEKG